MLTNHQPTGVTHLAGADWNGRGFDLALRRETAVFESYVAAFFNGEAGRDAMCRLKLEHSLRVLKNAGEIAAAESGRALPPEHAPLLILAALYHDLGRFEQLKRFGTFRDAESINHGRLGSQLLRSERFLAGLDRRSKGLVRLAVLMHNRPRLPDRLAPGLIPLCQALREADQLDILGIMRRELEPGRRPDPTIVLGLPDIAAAYTPAVLEKTLAGEDADYADMRYLNDFRILLCAWPGRMRFAVSLNILARQGHIDGILAGLPNSPAFAPLRSSLAGLLKTPGG